MYLATLLGLNGLRDYGTGAWEGGDPGCDHKRPDSVKGNYPESDRKQQTNSGSFQYRGWSDGICGRCGARRIDKQIGSEPSPDCGTHGQAQCGRCYVCTMVAVFREVKRVLHNSGSCWINLGDSYAGGGRGTQRNTELTGGGCASWSNRAQGVIDGCHPGLPSGNLVGIPWRVALALQADNWILRSDMPWVKRSAMPESATSRPAKALEYVFLLTKGMDYFFDMEAVRRPLSTPPHAPGNKKLDASRNDHDRMEKMWGSDAGRHFRNADLWFQSVSEPYGLVGVGDELVGLDVTTQGYPGAHFATYPPKLIEPCILAGSSAKGCCPCGAPWERVVEREWIKHPNGLGIGTETKDLQTHQRGKTSCMRTGGSTVGTTVDWQPTCACNLPEVVPGIVLDPFAGSGTTLAVAVRHNRRALGIELNASYIRLAEQRIAKETPLALFQE